LIQKLIHASIVCAGKSAQVMSAAIKVVLKNK